MMQKNDHVAKLYFLNEDCTDSCFLAFFPMKLYIGQVIYSNGDQFFDEEKTAILHYGSCVKKFIEFLLKSYVDKVENPNKKLTETLEQCNRN